jgi:hypothetical protein
LGSCENQNACARSGHAKIFVRGRCVQTPPIRFHLVELSHFLESFNFATAPIASTLLLLLPTRILIKHG